MTLYARYLAERESYSIIEDEIGFASFKIFDDKVYLRDIYVLPEHRQSGYATKLADKVVEVAKRAGCKIMMGSVDPRLNGRDQSVAALMGYGLKISHVQGHLVVFEKGI